MFKFRAYSSLPQIGLQEQLRSSGVKVFYYFGEKDWMDRAEFLKLVNRSKFLSLSITTGQAEALASNFRLRETALEHESHPWRDPPLPDLLPRHRRGFNQRQSRVWFGGLQR